jgi:hypothetical protein
MAVMVPIVVQPQDPQERDDAPAVVIVLTENEFRRLLSEVVADRSRPAERPGT